MSRRSSRCAFARGLAGLLAVTTVLQLRVARSAPADIFTSPAPVIGADPPKAADIKAGDATVSTQTGGVSWAYPIAVPPGRNGVAPSISLGYSSQAPTYGGVAAGFAWNLGLPEIREDTSESRIKTHSPLIELTEQDPRKDDRFLGLGGRRLVQVAEPKGTDAYGAYRAQGDDSFQRYERISIGPPYWRVRSTDGSVMEFGGASAACSNVSEGYAPLTRTLDQFGNEITYTYEEAFAGECRLKTIEWGANAAAGLANFAKVELMWQYWAPSCNGVRVGSQTDYRTGTKIVTGESTLSAIVVTAYPPGLPGSPEHTRQILLTYSAEDMACDQPHAPLRLLTSIQESAWITGEPAVNLPAVTLEYGDRAVVFENPSQAEQRPWGAWHLEYPAYANTLAWGYRYASPSTDPVDRTPTVEEMMVDLDGDALPDRLVNTSTETVDGNCSAVWQKNLGPDLGATEPRFGDTRPITLPRLKWNGLPASDSSPPPEGGGVAASSTRNEKCSLSGQVTAFWNSFDSPQCHDGTSTGSACRPATNPDDSTLYCDPNGRECPATLTDPDPFTSLYYRWIDVDGDGLTDLVAAVHGDIRTYDIEQGNYPAGSTRQAEPDLFGPWPACPTDVDRCKDVNPDCVISAHGDIAAINQCIDTAPTIPCDDLIAAPNDSPLSIPRGPYTRCEGLYPWFIFRNTGGGNFASPVIKYQPVPLESDQGDSSFGPHSGWASQHHGVMDFDGDGILDAVANPNQSGNQIWWVWFGDGTGGFEPKRHTFLTRVGALLSQSKIVAEVDAEDLEGLFDLNGDGYLDHWKLIDNQGNASVLFNTGTEHSGIDTVTTPAAPYDVKPGNDTIHDITDGGCVPPHPPEWTEYKCTYYAGSTYAQNRLFDVDNDGRVDLVKNIPSLRPNVSFNLGGQFNAPLVGLSNVNVQGLKRLTSVVGASPAPEGKWFLLTDHFDLDGDGIDEILDFESGSYKRSRQLNTDPPRLLTKVHNGRGAHTTIAYASMHDKTTVEQDSNTYWADHWLQQHPNASPRTQWVVKSLTTTDDFANTTATSSYFYKNPRHGPDDEGKYSFRGFEQVTTTAPSGAKTVERYGYDIDWSGRLVETLVMPNESEMIVENEVRSISRTTWVERELFSGTLKTHHAIVTEQFTCWNAADEATCEASPAGYTKTTINLVPLVPDGGTAPTVWMAKSSLLQAGSADAEGDRLTDSTFAFKSEPNLYRLRPLTTEKRVRKGASMDLYAKTATTWDLNYNTKLTDEVWFDANDNNRAITYFEYDPATGNLRKRWKPKQRAADKFTQYLYDSRKLFVATEINELGHQRDYTYEYGTGAKLMTEGPNERTCTLGDPGCLVDTTHPLKEQHKVVLDGLGRTIEAWDTVSDDGAVYELFERSTTTYVDTPSGSTPTSITNRVRLDTTSGTWTEETTELDGHGRPIKRTSFVQGSAPDNNVTVYTYRNDGTLATIELPDPSQNDSTRVTYSYTFDSLGRPTAIVRPDPEQSGVTITYSGLTTTKTAQLPFPQSRPTTITLHDSFGRVSEVRETFAFHCLPAEPVYMITSYAYGPDDSVITVIDPDGVTTAMKHDFAGHRTEITRHGRTWKYTYDLNGNLESEMVPGSPNPPVTDLAYTTFTVYDDLDRPISKDIGQRSLSAEDQDLFANRTETFQWDIGGNMIGQLRYWRSFAPGQSTAAIVHSTRFNNQGQLITAIQNLGIAGYPQLQRRFGRRYYLFGGVSETRFEDQLGGTNKTIANTYYDARALPTHMVLKRTGISDQTVAADTRNVAGLVTRRRTITPQVLLDSLWSYDALGRVTSQIVQTGIPDPIVRQDLTYFGTDNPSTLTHYLGNDGQQFNFTYDCRQQLKTVASATPGYFEATYDYGFGGRFSRVTEAQSVAPPAGSEVQPRDVNYQYRDADPERVTSLTNVSDGSTYAEYAYDEAGNLTQRCYGGAGIPNCTGESVDFVYDGKDQLRRATKRVNGVVQGSEEYWYDGTGQRIAVVKRDSGDNKIEMIWFIGDTEAHYDGSGNITHIYSHLSLGTPVARVDRTSNTGTSVEYQFHGLASNTIAAVAEDGTANATFSYAPFGEVIEASGASGGLAAHKRRLNDKYEDDLTSLTYYGARYYDKLSMNWTQSDPLYRFIPDLAKGSTPRRANLYQFSLSNPLRYIDPDGLDAGGSGYWTRGQRQQALDFAMAKEQKGASYGMTGTSVTPGKGGTATNQARELARALTWAAIDGTGELVCKAGQEGSKKLSDLTSSQKQALSHLLMTALTKSEELRYVVSLLISGDTGYSTLALKGSGETRTNGGIDEDGDRFAEISFNPNDTSAVWQGGLFQAGKSHGGVSSLRETTPDTDLAHELYHAARFVTGRDSGDIREEEIKACRFENVYRQQSGQMSRDAYNVEYDNVFFWRLNIPNY